MIPNILKLVKKSNSSSADAQYLFEPIPLNDSVEVQLIVLSGQAPAQTTGKIRFLPI